MEQFWPWHSICACSEDSCRTTLRSPRTDRKSSGPHRPPHTCHRTRDSWPSSSWSASCSCTLHCWPTTCTTCGCPCSQASVWWAPSPSLYSLLPHSHSTQFGIKVPEVTTLDITEVWSTINWFTVKRNFTKFVCHWGYQLVLIVRKKIRISSFN